MKIMVIGSGGREHAVIAKLRKSADALKAVIRSVKI